MVDAPDKFTEEQREIYHLLVSRLQVALNYAIQEKKPDASVYLAAVTWVAASAAASIAGGTSVKETREFWMTQCGELFDIAVEGLEDARQKKPN